jgi:hypothetical protein
VLLSWGSVGYVSVCELSLHLTHLSVQDPSQPINVCGSRGGCQTRETYTQCVYWDGISFSHVWKWPSVEPYSTRQDKGHVSRDRHPVNGTGVNHAAPCVTITDFRETTNVGTYKRLISDESLNSC